MPPTRKNEARSGEEIVLTQHEVGRKVASGPLFNHGRGIRPELDEQIAQLLTLECVKPDPIAVAGH